MAKYAGTIQGDGKAVRRMGGKSGVKAKVWGSRIGVEVWIRDKADGTGAEITIQVVGGVSGGPAEHEMEVTRGRRAVIVIWEK